MNPRLLEESRRGWQEHRLIPARRNHDHLEAVTEYPIADPEAGVLDCLVAVDFPIDIDERIAAAQAAVGEAVPIALVFSGRLKGGLSLATAACRLEVAITEVRRHRQVSVEDFRESWHPTPTLRLMKGRR